MQENASKRKGMRGDKARTLQPVLVLLKVKKYHLLTARTAKGSWDVPGAHYYTNC